MKKAILILFALTTSCATIMTGHTDYISLKSYPSGATFRTNSGSEGITPGGITVDEKEDVVVTFSKDGYEDAVIMMSPRTSKWVWGNLILGGVIGLIIDVASDGMDTHNDSAFVSLKES